MKSTHLSRHPPSHRCISIPLHSSPGDKWSRDAIFNTPLGTPHFTISWKLALIAPSLRLSFTLTDPPQSRTMMAQSPLNDLDSSGSIDSSGRSARGAPFERILL